MVNRKRVTIQVTKKKKTKRQAQPTVGRLGSALRALGGLGGTTIGSLIGMPTAGSQAGTSIGAALSRWLGSGDYSVSSNSLVNSMKASGTIPMMHKNDQSIVVRHREFLCEVVSASSFTVQRSFPLNPGMDSTFPWLARTASNFQQYRVRGMVFHYIPTSGSAVSSTNNALGSVMLQTSYRSTDGPPSSKVELLNEYWSSEAMPSEAFVHPIECNPDENPFNVQYVRSGALPAGENRLLYDLGTTHLAVSGQQATGVVLGDLWVTYEIELKKPIIDSNVTTSSLYYANFENLAPTAASPFGAGSTIIGNFLLSYNGRDLTFPVGVFGTFYIIVDLLGTFTGTTITGTGTASTGSSVRVWSTTLNRQEVGITTATTGSYQISYVKSNRDIATTYTLPLPTVGGTFTRCNVTVIGSTDIDL